MPKKSRYVYYQPNKKDIKDSKKALSATKKDIRDAKKEMKTQQKNLKQTLKLQEEANR